MDVVTYFTTTKCSTATTIDDASHTIVVDGTMRKATAYTIALKS